MALVSVNKKSFWRGSALRYSKRLGGRFAAKDTEELVKSSMLNILGTRVGTRIMLPEFGSHVPDLIFEPNDFILEKLLRRYTVEAIERWEPRLNVLTAEIRVSGHEVHMRLSCRLKSTQEIINLNLSVTRFEEIQFREV